MSCSALRLFAETLRSSLGCRSIRILIAMPLSELATMLKQKITPQQELTTNTLVRASRRALPQNSMVLVGGRS